MRLVNVALAQEALLPPLGVLVFRAAPVKQPDTWFTALHAGNLSRTLG